MIENGLIVTGGDAELLSRAIAEVKIKVYEESETSLDCAQALEVLVSGFMQPRVMDTKKKSFTHILTRYISALCSARLSKG